MKWSLILVVFATLMLSACFPDGGSCLDDNFCSVDEQLIGTCADCRPDLTPTNVELSYRSDGISDTLREGETKTYSLNGVDYEVTLVFVSNPLTGAPEAKFSVNGELTQALSTGASDTLSGGLMLTIEDILVNDREGVVMFRLGTPDAGFLYYNYCLTNKGGSYEGPVDIRFAARGDVSSDPDERDSPYVSFQKPIIYGNYQVIRSGNNIMMQHNMQTGGNEEQSYCFGYAKPVRPSRYYNLFVDVDPEQKIVERDETNNNGYARIDGVAVFYPQYLVEYDVGGEPGYVHYQYSGMGDTQVFPSGGQIYVANYQRDLPQGGNGFSATVYVPNNQVEGQNFFAQFNDWQTGDVATGTSVYGVKYRIEPYTFDFNGVLYTTVSVAFMAPSGVVLHTAFAVPVSPEYTPATDEFVREYVRKLVPPSPPMCSSDADCGTGFRCIDGVCVGTPIPVDQCSVNPPFNCHETQYTRYGNTLSASLQNNAGEQITNVTGVLSCAGRWLRGDWITGGNVVKVTLDSSNRVVQFEGIPGAGGTIQSVLTPTSTLTVWRGDLNVGGVTHRLEYDAITKTLTIDWAPQTFAVVLYGGVSTTLSATEPAVPNGGNYTVKGTCDTSDWICDGFICSVHGDFAMRYVKSGIANIATGNLDLSVPVGPRPVGPPIADTWELQ